MKISEGFIYKKMHGMGVIVPVGERSHDFRGMVTLNETGSFLWEKLESEKELSREALVEALLSEYDTDRETAARDVDAFLSKLKEAGVLAD